MTTDRQKALDDMPKLPDIRNDSECDKYFMWALMHYEALQEVLAQDEWQDISTAPRDKLIQILPKMGMPFIGDIWAKDCKKRRDIKEDELIRVRLPNGNVWTSSIGWAEKWKPVTLPPPPTTEDNQWNRVYFLGC